jgi:hypothetical protein
MSGKRQKTQLWLAFSEEGRSEAPMAPGGGSETLTAKRMNESPAKNHEQLMEEVCERENCLQAFKRVKSNKRSAGRASARSRRGHRGAPGKHRYDRNHCSKITRPDDASAGRGNRIHPL